MRLALEALGRIPAGVQVPAYDVAALKSGIVHLGLGAFHRAHQAVFTEDAIAGSGGDWGIVGVSMRKPDVAESLTHQDDLFTVETLNAEPRYRVVGAVRRTLTLPLQPRAVMDALTDSAIRIITLTVTEKGYCLAGDGLDLTHPDIVHDLVPDTAPRSAVGLLVTALAKRDRTGAGPVTVISCDNVAGNGPRLATAVQQFAERVGIALPDGLATFPETMVDCIVPATDAASRARIEAAIGMGDQASVQREPFAQWVIEDRFAGPRPAWGEGVNFTADVASYRRLKLHVLNATHSALAYLGQGGSNVFVREAVAEPYLASYLDAMVAEEIAPALPGLPVAAYWQKTRARFANPMLDHRLDQIAQDGAAKLAERLYPLMSANLKAGRPVGRMAAVVRAWLDSQAPGGLAAERVLDPGLFPAAFRDDPRLGAAVIEARP